jgi:hypothetical protein
MPTDESTTSKATASSSDYSPSVGDVVEFERSGDTCKGLIYFETCFSELKLISNWGGGHYSHCSPKWNTLKNLRKIESTDLVPESCDVTEMQAIAKAYFASPPAKREFAVGDRVRVTESMCSIDVGVITVVDKIFNDGKLRLTGSVGSFKPCWVELAEASKPTFTPDLALSYAENQAAWIEFHGLKVGSKVKVVKKFKQNEQGFDGLAWDAGNSKMASQGKIMSIKRIDDNCIVLIGQGTNAGNYYPYFALEPA